MVHIKYRGRSASERFYASTGNTLPLDVLEHEAERSPRINSSQVYSASLERSDTHDAQRTGSVHAVPIVSHHGHTLTGGHYTCDVRVASAGGGNAQWWHCDDARVSRVTPADVKTRQAYVLFYERVLEPI
eukprot:scaffold91673_cov32-Tisochrysis_lutea.AAC.5